MECIYGLFFDKFDIPEIEKLVPNKIPVSNLLIIGNLDLDPGEEKFLKKHSILILNRNDGLRLFQEFVNKFSHLHISFDIDSMDKTIAPSTGIPADDGLLFEDIKPILEIISKHPSFSFDLCEVNPKKAGAEKTVLLAQRILRTIL